MIILKYIKTRKKNLKIKGSAGFTLLQNNRRNINEYFISR